LAESVNGLFKSELIGPGGPWRSVEQVEIAMLEWIDWYNHRRLHSALGISHRWNLKPSTTLP
jgi:putative transposase